MNEENKAIQPESQPEPEMSDSVDVEKQDQEPLEPDQVQEPSPEKQPPSKIALFLRKGLIGLLIVAALFFAGFLTDHFVRYNPTAKELEQANQELSDLEEENDRLTSANQAANEEIATLEAELTAATANMKFYQVLVDVNTARIELFMEDIESAQAALTDTQDNLEDLLPFIEEVDAELALSLPRRLELIIAGLERDPETGLIDLELFVKDLLELEPLLVEE
jgi:DNA repair exonuclease SbcCD ATPase subunit